VGFGNAARFGHLPWYAATQNVSLAAIIEPSPHGRRIATAAVPTAAVFDSVDAMFGALNVDFIDVASPPATHAQAVAAGVAAGAHVFCEKPFVMSRAELEPLAGAAAHKLVVVEPCHNWLHGPAIRNALSHVNSGELGPPSRVAFSALRSRPAPGADYGAPDWRDTDGSNGGILADLGYHGMYLAMRVFGVPPQSVDVSDVVYGAGRSPTPLAANCRLDFGVLGVSDLKLSWLASARKTEFLVRCERGSVSVMNDCLSIESGDRVLFKQSFGGAEDSWHAAWIGRSLDQFIAAIGAPERHGCLTEASVCSVLMLEAALTSAHAGRPVRLDVRSTWSHCP
jgi:predicted dehydrogenase